MKWLRRSLFVLGVLNLLVLSTHSLLSYVEAGAARYNERPYRHIVFHTAIGERVVSLASKVVPDRAFIRIGRHAAAPAAEGVSLPEDASVLREFRRQAAWAIGGDWLGAGRFIYFYAWPLLISTSVAIAVLGLIVLNRSLATLQTVALLRRFGYVLALPLAFALPVVSGDLWTSLAAGRALLDGTSPYAAIAATAVEGLPLDPPVASTVHGPLWIVVSWIAAALSGGSVLWAAVVLKSVLVAAWCGMLRMVSVLVRQRQPWEQCAAMIVTGWLPLGVVQTVGDGGSDALAAVGVLGWLVLLQRERTFFATLVLGLSAAVDWTITPLLILDFLFAGFARRNEIGALRATARAYAPNAIVFACILAAFYLPLGAWTVALSSQTSFVPSDAARALAVVLGFEQSSSIAHAATIVLPLVTIVALNRWFRMPSLESLHLAAAGVLLSMLLLSNDALPLNVVCFSVVALTLTWGGGLWSVGLGFALAAPFVLLYGVAYPDSVELKRLGVPSLIFYSSALAVTAVAWVSSRRTSLKPASAR